MTGALQLLKYLAVAVALLLGLLVALFLLGAFGVPEAGVADNEWGDAGDDRLEVVTTMWVDNPNPIGATVDRVEYEVELNGVRVANETMRDVVVEPGNQTITARTDLNVTRLPEWWVTHVSADESGVRETTEVEVVATAHYRAFGQTISRRTTYEERIETDLEGTIADSLSELEGEYQGSTGVRVAGQPIRPTVEVRDATARWGPVDEEATTLYATLEVHNPNAYPIPRPGFAGEYRANDVRVLRWRAGDAEVVEGPDDDLIRPNATEEVVLRLRMDNDRFAQWFENHVEDDERSNATLTAHLEMDVLGSEIRVPREGAAVRCQYDVRTSLLVEQPAGVERESCEYAAWNESGGVDGTALPPAAPNATSIPSAALNSTVLPSAAPNARALQATAPNAARRSGAPEAAAARDGVEPAGLPAPAEPPDGDRVIVRRRVP